jgi:hypothetical protein
MFIINRITNLLLGLSPCPALLKAIRRDTAKEKIFRQSTCMISGYSPAQDYSFVKIQLKVSEVVRETRTREKLFSGTGLLMM